MRRDIAMYLCRVLAIMLTSVNKSGLYYYLTKVNIARDDTSCLHGISKCVLSSKTWQVYGD